MVLLKLICKIQANSPQNIPSSTLLYAPETITAHAHLRSRSCFPDRLIILNEGILSVAQIANLVKTNSRRCVLGLIDVEKVHDCFHEYFIDQLQRLEEGGYCTRLLPWKPDHACLPPNKELTLGRLRSVTRKLESRCKDLKTVVKQQLEKGTLEVVPEIANMDKPYITFAINY